MNKHSELTTRLREIVGRIGTQAEAAKVAGISLAQLKNYLSGNTVPSLLPAQRLVDAAGTTVAWLCRGEDGPHRESSPSASEQREIDVFLMVALRYANKPTDENANDLRIAASDIRSELETYCTTRSSVRL